MTKPTILESFCRIAEANQAGVDAYILAAERTNLCLNVSDMTALAAEIRKLQARVFEVDAQQLAAALATPIAFSPAELESIAHEWGMAYVSAPYADPLHAFRTGPDGEVDIVLDSGATAELPDSPGTGYFFGNPMRIVGKLARPKVDQFPEHKPAADADGWIAWAGGECPVDGDTLVEVKLRNGNVCKGSERARYFRWNHLKDGQFPGNGDIVAYRVQRSAAAPISNPPTTPDADGFYPPSTKPVKAGVYRTWFTSAGAGEGGFSSWDGDRWNHECLTPKEAETYRDFRDTAAQEKHWKPI